MPGPAREAAAAEGLTPLEYMRRYGAFEVSSHVGQVFEEPVDDGLLADAATTDLGRVYSPAPKPPATNLAPMGAPVPDAEGRHPVGVDVDGEVKRGFPTPSGLLEFYSSTLADWGWPEYAVPTYIKSHIHPEHLAADQVPAHLHLPAADPDPHPQRERQVAQRARPDQPVVDPPHRGDAARARAPATSCGSPPTSATSSSRRGSPRASAPGSWRAATTWAGGVPQEQPERHGGQTAATVDLARAGSTWTMKRLRGVGPYESSDPDTARIWWTDVGVHQNMTFAVHPDPISGMHCWHQAVRVTRAEPGDSYGDISVDTDKSRALYREWLARTRDARQVSPDGTRRPYWLMRPLKPGPEVFRIPDEGRE